MNTVDRIEKCALEMGRPLYVQGPAGVGKSSMISQAAKNAGYTVFTTICSNMLPEDGRGLPFLDIAEGNKRNVVMAYPDVFPSLADWDKKILLVFDELSNAPPAVQNVVMQIFLEHRCGPHKLSPNTRVIAAGNKPEHGAFARTMSAPMRNRLIIINVEPQVNRWTEWAFSNKVHPTVISYLNWRPESLYILPKDNSKPFPSGRSWEFVSDFVRNGVDDFQLLAGAVGDSAAAEYQAYVAELQYMPDVDKLLDGSETYHHNASRPSISYAITVNLVFRVTNNVNKLDPAIKVVENLGSEFTALLFNSLLKADSHISDTKYVKVISHAKVRDWASKNASRENNSLIYA
tara:strand:+ start:2701 stop:3741 length:1041 start_codon:yes stop_codon:yes gene_type:complete